jgi:hypothetical protein
LGDSPYEVQVGDRRVKVLDPWRVGLLCSFVPFYAVFWWYRAASDMRALGNETRNDNVRLSPPLMTALVLFSGAFVPMVFAVVLLAQAVREGQRQAGSSNLMGPLVTVAALVVLWVAPVAVIIAVAAGGSVSAAVGALLVAIVLSLALSVVFYEELQFHLNSIWSRRRPGSGAQAVEPQAIAA